MEKFKKMDVVCTTTTDGKNIYLIVSWPVGDNPNTFQGTVISSEYDYYKLGEHSRTWHQDKFELAPKGLEFKIST